MPSHPKIAIVGGGPAGLALGLLLHRRNVPVTIFDLRPKPTDAELDEPSGLLDLHEGSGLAAVEACGLMDEFLPLTALCSQSMAIVNGQGQVLLRHEDDSGNRPEISRHDLSRLFMRHLPDDCVRWQHKLGSATLETKEGRAMTTLDFGTNGTFTFDLVVGADGAWSRVRKILTDVLPEDTGMQYITATIRGITTKYPSLAEFVGTGSMLCPGAGNCLMSFRAAQDSALVYLCIPTRNGDLFASAAGRPASEVKELLLGDPRLLGTFDGLARELISTACEEDTLSRPGQNVDLRRVHAFQAGHSWENKAGVTLIGDAAHVMSPFAGEGVNMAMADALELAGVIAAAWETSSENAHAFQSALEVPVADFEKQMTERAGEKAEETVVNTKMMFAPDGAKAMVEFFESMAGEQGGQ